MAYRIVPGAPTPIGTDLLALIGNTPLVKIRRLADLPPAVEVYAKLEGHNPGGSVKDRAVLRMVEDAERAGRLRPGAAEPVLLDSTSGNAGIAYAMVAAVRGYRVTLVVPANASEERLATMRAYGAELVLSDPLEGSDGAMLMARRMADERPDRYLYLNQYDNPGNWRAHYDGTGAEVIAQTHGRITHFVAGVGTTGTLVGAGRRLRAFHPAVEVIAAEPDDAFHGIEGWKHLPTAITPGIYDPSVAHRVLRVTTDQAYALTRALAATEGIFAGPSSGAALAAALTVARDLAEGVVVVIFPDSGARYLSTPVWRAARV
ncbi:MAG: cysteine synthase family protein [Armatimonadota bacterium]|nr:cysteine synthase family protein [Armatimonadota bacterium]MDR7421828.1 cysteine synthase family protein [Armatimonadota bacterium]MDR7457011.1 cysteine synthase family protein [Armatimonadota bacterium]MDR7497536.1 cysteine synthase family protein [Armatimonadota bacterium]MDR7511120.1 cysteine synthase family protein [Armatimonadota bacterium]